MTDVRLTATNPEDSSVVPVSCNAKGELLLEETPGFDGNVDGDLTVSGGASFANGYTNGGVSIASSGGIACGSYLQAGGDVGPRAILNSGDVLLGYNNGVMTSSILKEGTLRLGGALDSGGYNTELNSNGSATFAGTVKQGDILAGGSGGNYMSAGEFAAYAPGASNRVFRGWNTSGSSNVKTSEILGNGSATFNSDVVVGSRNKKWMIVESNGLAHLVEQPQVSVMDDAAKYPELRNIPEELDLIEKALGDVMEKLRMNPPAGWPVWDGSDEI